MNKTITYFIKNKKYYKGTKEISIDTLKQELKKYQLDKLEQDKKVNVRVKTEAKLGDAEVETEKKIKRYQNSDEYRFMVDNPKALLDAQVYVNDGIHGKIDKIVRKDPPFTIYKIKFDNYLKDKEK